METEVGYCPQPEDIDYIVAEIRQRRVDQDVKWGGPAHDDTHHYYDWLSYINKFREKAYGAAVRFNLGSGPEEAYEDALIDIAALAVAAIQSHRRIRFMGRS